MDVLNRVPVREQEPAVRAKNFEDVLAVRMHSV